MAKFRIQRVKAGLRKRLESALGKSRGKDMSELQEFYRHIWAEASAQLSAQFDELAPGIWRVSSRDASTIISNFKVQMDDLVILNIAGHKGLTYQILREHNLPVPDYLMADCSDIASSFRFMEKYPGEFFVVKPEAETSGACGVTTHIRNRTELVAACALASLFGRKLLIERYVVGEPYRLLILDGKLIHASRRRGVWIVGDGRSSVRELQKGEGLYGAGGDSFLPELSAQGVTPEAVPELGRRIYLGYFPNQSKGQERFREVRTVFNEDATEQIGPELTDQAVLAAQALGSRFAGVDIITLDPAVSLERSGGIINEVNTTPGLHHHYNLLNQCQTPAAVPVLRHLLGMDAGESGRDLPVKRVG